MATNCGEALELASLTIYKNVGLDIVYPDIMNLQEVNIATNGAFELTAEGLSRPKWEREITNSANFVEQYQDTFSFNLLGLNEDTIAELNKIRDSRTGFIVRALTVEGENLVFLTPSFISNNSIINVNKRSAVIEMRYKVPTFENFKGINLISIPNTTGMGNFIQFVNTFTKTTTSSITVGSANQLTDGMPIKYKLNISERLNNTVYATYDYYKVDGKFYMCINSGTTNVTQPTMSTEFYTDTSDGSATFRRIEDYMYGLIDSISVNVLNIKGVSIDHEILELWYGSQEGVVLTDIVISDASFAQIDTSIEAKYGNEPTVLQNGKVVKIETWQLTEDTGATNAALSFKNGTFAIRENSTYSLNGNATFNDTGVTIKPSYYQFAFGDVMRIDIPIKGSEGNTKSCKYTVYQIII